MNEEINSKTTSNNILVSFSGGRSFALMAKMMREDSYWSAKNLLFCFANTGKEKPQTLEFVDRCDREFSLKLVWVEAKVNPGMGNGTSYRLVSYCTASRNGEPFEDVTAKYGISNKAFPHCSRELKQRPINAYAKSQFGVGGYVTALGIRADEPKRLRKGEEFVFPLAGWGITTKYVRDFWAANHFDLQLPDYAGNCDLCWKKSRRKLLTLIREDPKMAEWWMKMEEKYALLQIPGRGENAGAFWNRGNTPMIDLVKMAKEPFIPCSDPLFIPDSEMDEESPCQCFRQEIEIGPEQYV